jgi:toxin ParE1/3/4
MATVQWTIPAVAQLTENMLFLAKGSAARAEEMRTRLVEASERLERFPLMGRVVPEFKLESYREVIVRPFRLIYRVRDDVCSIIAVVHSRRDLTQLLLPEIPDKDDESTEE